jgi:CMP/dCMP kinase
LGYRYLDTGAMYRGIAFAYRTAATKSISEFLARLRLSFSFERTTLVFLDGVDISDKIRTPDISLLASSFSQDREVRAYLTQKQRETGLDGGIVVEGRDTGSVVFPQADVKFYLDANIDERARRRYLELAGKETGEDLTKVKGEIEKRDRDDSRRAVAPLTKPDGAFCIDTTGMTIEEVVLLLERHVRWAEI